VQLAAVEALDNYEHIVKKNSDVFQTRRDLFIERAQSFGWGIPKPKTTFYLWTRVPVKKMSSADFAKLVLERAHVVITPGNGFGSFGEGFIRLALTVEDSLLLEAVNRLGKVLS
jgi:LL-diaminopimelate aminotransferase